MSITASCSEQKAVKHHVLLMMEKFYYKAESTIQYLNLCKRYYFLKAGKNIYSVNIMIQHLLSLITSLHITEPHT